MDDMEYDLPHSLADIAVLITVGTVIIGVILWALVSIAI